MQSKPYVGLGPCKLVQHANVEHKTVLLGDAVSATASALAAMSSI